jgi:D-alanyl-D-alanine carboxypeptidase/D-alanyl-D-alanine-endopeptidase (penicillin-binding protein 4)
MRPRAARYAAAVCAVLAIPGALRASAVRQVNAAVRATDAASSPAVGAEGDKASRRKTTTRTKRDASTRRTTTKGSGSLRYTSSSGELGLAADLATLLHARVKRGDWGVVVSSLTRGDTLFSWHPDDALIPASTLKLFTTALAFDRLGPSHQFATDVFRDGSVAADGTLQGSLFLRGGGDPALSGRFVAGGPDGPMRAIARLVADAGIKHIRGDIVGDASAFDAKRVPDGWLARYLDASYASRVSALSLNENLLHVAIAPSRTGNPAIVSLVPATVAYKVVSTATTSARGSGARLTVGRRPDGTIIVRGWIGASAGMRFYTVVVDDPALFATGALREALVHEGVTVGGTVRLGNTPPTAAKVVSFSSPPLSSLASAMNRESINHFAELIFRDAARTGDAQGIGSAESGNALLQQFLQQKVGAAPNAVRVADGSGLSTLDRITARSLVQLLGYANQATWSREFHETLPVAGQSELLRHRMISTPAQGNLHAKTGTTNEVIALGGYVTSQGGELLAFSFIYNGRERWTAKETIDAMGATLAAWRR